MAETSKGLKKTGILHSIWDNDYYNKMPLPKWCYQVSFESFIKYHQGDDVHRHYADILNKAIVNCQWPKREMSIVKTYYAGVEANFTGRVQNCGELNITFNENANMNVSKILDEIFNGECSNDEYFEGKGGYYSNVEFNKIDRIIDLKIVRPSTNMVHGGDDAEIVGWVTFHNCILVSIDESEFSYDTPDDCVTRTARIAYDYAIDHRRSLKSAEMYSRG